MAKRRRKRLKWYAGGGVILILVFVLGDPWGLFREGRFGLPSPTPNASKGERGLTGGTVDPNGSVAGAAETGTAGSGTAETGAGAEERSKDARDPSRGARLDQMLGIIHRHEQALSADRLADLAVLVGASRRSPPDVPASLRDRWKQVQTRAEEALDCGARLRKMIRAGEILGVRQILVPLRQPATPAWMRKRLDTAATAFGWPSLTKNWCIASERIGDAESTLAKLRRVRFLKDGVMHEGELWRCSPAEATVRVQDGIGFTYPMVARGDVEPVEPESDEAYRQGIAAARSGDAIGVVLWACHFHELGATEHTARLRTLVE